jgi:hypothetical protein
LAVLTFPLDGSVIVQLRVVEGEGMVYPVGARATRGLTVLVTDETGKPVEGAAVSFRLPEEGPSGTFSGGLRTQVVTTQGDGKATVWGMQWNKTPGPLEIRITAVKDQARAGIVSTQYLDATVVPKSGGSGTFSASHHWGSKALLWTAIGIGAGAGAGLMYARLRPSTVTVVPLTAAPIAPQIGAPSIIISHP